MRIGLSLKLSEPKYNVLAQNIRALFADGSQGWWYDDNDTTTLFQDSAGTTPVTAVEQFVGLQLDKSKGLVLGPNVVPNSISNAAWVTISGAPASTVSGDQLTFGGQFSGRRCNVSTVAGTRYEFSFTAKRISGNTALHFFHELSESGNTTAFTITDTATKYTCIVLGRSGGGLVVFGIQDRNASGWGTIEVSNISIRELPGNHRYAPASGNRPIWSKRVNLLTKTEQFDDAYWTVKTNVSVSANSASSPDGTVTADKIVENTSAGVHGLYQTASVFTAGVVQAASVYAKAGERSWLFVTFANDSNLGAWFNLSAGTVGTRQSLNISATIVDDGDGWYRCTITFSPTKTNPYLSFYIGTADNTSNYTGDGTSGIYIWGADVRPANQATGTMPLYQRVNTSSDYDTNGFPGYLKADGVDDFLQTNSIDFTATDKITLCAGVRKLSDAATAMAVELSASLDANNGTFNLLAPSQNGVNSYRFSSKGTTPAVAGTGSFAAAPDTAVLTGIGNISGDVATLRRNGAEVATSTTDQGTGNYGNYPAYFFQRNSPAGLRFNGNEYGNIAVGKLLTADQLRALETYVNGLTRAY